jgi:hypothetical protein
MEMQLSPFLSATFGNLIMQQIEQGGIRPVLVLQNDAGNFFSPIIM